MSWGEVLFFVIVALFVIAFVVAFASVLIPLAFFGGGMWIVFGVLKIGSS